MRDPGYIVLRLLYAVDPRSLLTHRFLLGGFPLDSDDFLEALFTACGADDLTHVVPVADWDPLALQPIKAPPRVLRFAMESGILTLRHPIFNGAMGPRQVHYWAAAKRLAMVGLHRIA